jgi:hypothetical protein
MEDAQVRYQRPRERLMQPERVMLRRARKTKKPKRCWKSSGPPPLTGSLSEDSFLMVIVAQ